LYHQLFLEDNKYRQTSTILVDVPFNHAVPFNYSHVDEILEYTIPLLSMKKIDRRKFKLGIQQALRNQVISPRKQGKKNKDVAEFVGISRQHAGTLWQKHVRGEK